MNCYNLARYILFHLPKNTFKFFFGTWYFCSILFRFVSSTGMWRTQPDCSARWDTSPTRSSSRSKSMGVNGTWQFGSYKIRRVTTSRSRGILCKQHTTLTEWLINYYTYIYIYICIWTRFFLIPRCHLWAQLFTLQKRDVAGKFNSITLREPRYL